MRKTSPASFLRRARVPRITRDALGVLKRCPWPGNYRELETVLLDTVVRAERDVINVWNLPPELLAYARESDRSTSSTSLEEARDKAEKDCLIRALVLRLVLRHGNVSEAAQDLKVSRSRLNELIKKHGIDPQRFR